MWLLEKEHSFVILYQVTVSFCPAQLSNRTLGCLCLMHSHKISPAKRLSVLTACDLCVGHTYCIINTTNHISKDFRSCLKRDKNHSCHSTVLLPCTCMYAMRSGCCSEERITNIRDEARRVQRASLICGCINVKK